MTSTGLPDTKRGGTSRILLFVAGHLSDTLIRPGAGGGPVRLTLTDVPRQRTRPLSVRTVEYERLSRHCYGTVRCGDVPSPLLYRSEGFRSFGLTDLLVHRRHFGDVAGTWSSSSSPYMSVWDGSCLHDPTFPFSYNGDPVHFRSTTH